MLNNEQVERLVKILRSVEEVDEVDEGGEGRPIPRQVKGERGPVFDALRMFSTKDLPVQPVSYDTGE